MDPLFATRLGFILLLIVAVSAVISKGRAVGATMREFFLEEQPPINLALLRIFTFYIIGVKCEGAVQLAELPSVLVVYPPGWEWLAPVLPLNARFVAVVEALLAVFSLLATVGLFTRLTAPIAALLAVYIYLLPNLQGSVGHGMHVHVLSALVLAASPAGDALSIDAVIRRWRGLPAPPPRLAYTVPVRFCWLLLGTMYLFPGLWKLWESGDLWLNGTKLRVEIFSKWAEHPDNRSLLRVDQWPIMLAVFGSSALLFEISFFFLLFQRTTRVIAGLWAAAFHVGVFLLMNIAFNPLHPLIVLLDYPEILKLRPVRWLVERWNAKAAQRTVVLRERLSVLPAIPLPSFLRRADAPFPERSAAGAFVVGIVLLYGMFQVGLTKVESWPLSVYPCFSRRRTEPPTEGVALGAFLQPKDGPRREIAVDFSPFADTNGIHNLLQAAVRDKRRRRASTAKLDAIMEIVRKNAGNREPGDELLFYEWRFPADPADRTATAHDQRFLSKLTF